MARAVRGGDQRPCRDHPALVQNPAGALRLRSGCHLLELCLPTLRGISVPQYQTFRELLLSWISADGKTALSEWCLFQMVRHTFDAERFWMRALPDQNTKA